MSTWSQQTRCRAMRSPESADFLASRALKGYTLRRRLGNCRPAGQGLLKVTDCKELGLRAKSILSVEYALGYAGFDLPGSCVLGGCVATEMRGKAAPVLRLPCYPVPCLTTNTTSSSLQVVVTTGGSFLRFSLPCPGCYVERSRRHLLKCRLAARRLRRFG